VSLRVLLTITGGETGLLPVSSRFIVGRSQALPKYRKLAVPGAAESLDLGATGHS
jgi:hypothetical protein